MKKNGSIHEEKSSLKVQGLLIWSKLEWASYIIPTAKTAFKKIGALVCSMKSISA